MGEMTKIKQILLGILISVIEYLLIIPVSASGIVFGFYIVIVPVIVTVLAVKLIRKSTYKALGITLLVGTVPILIMLLLAGICFSMFNY